MTKDVNVAAVWDAVMARWPFTRTRVDQAVITDHLEQPRAGQVKVEISYGSRTVRLRLFHGDRLIQHWDMLSGGPIQSIDPKLAELGAQLATLGIEER